MKILRAKTVDVVETPAEPSTAHRDKLLGDWDEVGQLQLDYLRAVGLERTDKLLDIGCGPLRGGVKFIDYLLADNYYGIDANIDYLRAGTEIELPQAGVARKLPEANIRLDDRFGFSKYGVEFDMAIAHGLFSELSLNDIRLCLYEAARVLGPHKRLFATIHDAPSMSLPADRVKRRGAIGTSDKASGKVTTSASKPYHYSLDDLTWAANGLGWKLEPVGEWGHPSGEHLVAFRRTHAVLRSPRIPGDTDGLKTTTAVVNPKVNRIGNIGNRVRRFSNR